MNLPVFKNFSKPLKQMGAFRGIAEDELFDVVNLVCSEKCHTRNPRKAVMLYKTTPDQIISCENRLFFRFGNILKEIIKNADGTFLESDSEYALKELDPAPDRSVILWDDKLYVLPDRIQIGTDTWLPFAESYSSSLAFPFINPRTLYYPNGFVTSECCEEAAILKVGMKLRFSWAPSKEFNIKTVESKIYTLEESIIEEGLRITLDADVPLYNRVPANAKAEYTNPQNRPILNDLIIGYNHKIVFEGDSIGVFDYGEDYFFTLEDYFKVGQMVKISGSSVARNNITAKITKISDRTINFDYEFTTTREEANTTITLTPLIPELSHFLLTEDRLFGIDNSTGEFYISALKEPFLFHDFPSKPEDGWIVKINGKGTGIALWKDCIICFTEDGGFRILGYHALNFGLRQLSLNGIKSNNGGSLIRVGDTLYYSSEKGIMKYSGGSDKKISGSISQVLNVKSAVTDGSFVYMLSNNRIWVYDTVMERWWSENAENITDIFKFDGQIYLVSPETIYISESLSDTEVNWSFELPFLKNMEHKKLLPLYIALNYSADTNCDMTLFFRTYGNSDWKACGTYKIEKEGSIKIPIPKNYCNNFKIKIEGRGTFAPDSWCIYYNDCSLSKR